MYVIGYEHLVINDLLSWTAEGICLKHCVAKVIVAVNYKKKKIFYNFLSQNFYIDF